SKDCAIRNFFVRESKHAISPNSNQETSEIQDRDRLDDEAEQSSFAFITEKNKSVETRNDVQSVQNVRFELNTREKEDIFENLMSKAMQELNCKKSHIP